MTKHIHRDLPTTNQKNRPFGLQRHVRQVFAGRCGRLHRLGLRRTRTFRGLLRRRVRQRGIFRQRNRKRLL